VPEFKYILLFVSKLLINHPLFAIFHHDKFCFKDLLIRMMIAIGQKNGGLYTLHHTSVGVLDVFVESKNSLGASHAVLVVF